MAKKYKKRTKKKVKEKPGIVSSGIVVAALTIEIDLLAGIKAGVIKVVGND